MEKKDSCTCEDGVNNWSHSNLSGALYNLIMVCQMIPSLKQQDLVEVIQNFTNSIFSDFVPTLMPLDDKAMFNYLQITHFNASMIHSSWENSLEKRFKVIVEGYLVLFLL